MPTTATMRALAMTAFGGPEVLAVHEVARPAPGPGEVLVRVHAAALNHIDLFVLGGLPKASYTWPHVVGADGAGRVEAVGDGVTALRPGARVLVNPGLWCAACPVCAAGEHPLCREYRILGEHLEGTMAEYLVVPARNAVPIPEDLSWAEAAAFPLATLTAWRMLMTRARVRAGETVLIWGVGGGVALQALQIARLAGARVVVTSSSDTKLEAARGLGADLTLNHTRDDVVRAVRDLTGAGADVVVDSVGEATWDQSLRALRPMGRLVTCGATTGPRVALDLRRLFWFQWSLLGSTMGTQAEFLEVVRLLGRGRLRPLIDSITPLAEGATAFARLADGRQLGKLVLEVTP